MAYRTYYKKGSYNVTCDICGLVKKAEQTKMDWHGRRVCMQDWEPQWQLDLQRKVFPSPREGGAVRNPRPQQSIVSVSAAQWTWDLMFQPWEEIQCNWEDV